MQMKAIDDRYTTERGTLMGIKAGLDMACISHDLEKQVGALKLIETAIQKGEISEELIDEKVENSIIKPGEIIKEEVKPQTSVTSQKPEKPTIKASETARKINNNFPKSSEKDV